MNLRGNILILTQWSFKDALVQTYTLPYVEIVRKVIPADKKIILITSEQEQMALSVDEINAINSKWQDRNMQLVAQPYKHFGWKKIIAGTSQLFALRRLIVKEKVSVIHAFCTPAGSIGYLLSKMTGTPLVIDSYEPHAEPMVETGTWKKNGIAFRTLFWLEKKLSQRAQYIIATTAGMKQYAWEKYNVELKNFFVKPACIDFDFFYPRHKDTVLEKEFQFKEKIVLVYAGKLGGTYLKDEVFDFVKSCYDYWGDKFRFLMLSNERDKEIEGQMKRAGLPQKIVTKRFVFHHEIPRYLSLGDFAINPQFPVPSKRYGAPIKNGEYWAMGLPVVISPSISVDSDIIQQNGIGVVADLRQKENYSTVISSIADLLTNTNREGLQSKMFEVAKQHRSFTIAENIYKTIYS